MLVSPSILASDFSRLAQEVKSIEEAGADLVHIDVMDGIFVPNITLGAPVISCLKDKTSLPFDVHLMIHEPKRYIKDFAEAGADIITFHTEATNDVAGTIAEIKKYGCKPAISIKPDTNVNVVYPYLDDVYMVLVMTVEPGFGGQSFMPKTLLKIKKIRDAANAKNLDLRIQVDGGIDKKTAPAAVLSGADVLVAGSYIFKSADRKAAIDTLKNAQ